MLGKDNHRGPAWLDNVADPHSDRSDENRPIDTALRNTRKPRARS